MDTAHYSATKARRIAIIGVLLGLVAAIGGGTKTAFAQNTVVVPQALANVEGNSFTDLPFVSSPVRTTFLQYIPATQNGNVAGLNVGDRITGLRFRLDNAETVSPSRVTIVDYDIFLGQGVATPPTGTSPASAGRQFANYYTAGTRQQVRDGALDLPAGTFPSSASGTTPEAFASPIGFGTYDSSGNLSQAREYIYQGGALVYEVQYSGASNRIRVDFETDTSNADGFVLLFKQDNSFPAGTSDARLDRYALVTGFDVVNIPEPASAALFGIVGLVGLVARRRRI